jgi:hypothetical protein
MCDKRGSLRIASNAMREEGHHFAGKMKVVICVSMDTPSSNPLMKGQYHTCYFILQGNICNMRQLMTSSILLIKEEAFKPFMVYTYY